MRACNGDGGEKLLLNNLKPGSPGLLRRQSPQGLGRESLTESSVRGDAFTVFYGALSWLFPHDPHCSNAPHVSG